MDFNLTIEQQAFIETAAQFAKDNLMPKRSEWDETHFFPVDVLKSMASLGFSGMNASESIGGSGLSRLDSALIYEQLAFGCVATTAYLTIHNMVINAIDTYGSSQVKERFGRKLTQMDYFSSYCLTEPNAGSDAASLKTTATKVEGGYIINGSKSFISGAGVSDVYLVMARTGDSSYKGISCFIVEKGSEGIRFGKNERKMGWRAQPTAMVFFESCFVPEAHLIGQEGEGFKIALNALNGGRINIAACSLGGALFSISKTKLYMNERRQFNQTLSEMPLLRQYFADMSSHYEMARLMVYKAAFMYDNKSPDAPMFCAMAKKLATDNAYMIANKALQLHGGYGYLCEYGIEQIVRDLRVHQILEGTNEIMGEIIAKHLFQSTIYD